MCQIEVFMKEADKDDLKIPIIPGRGLTTHMSMNLRHEFMAKNELEHQHLSVSTLDLKSIQNNIESYVGAIEIPVGIVGPLRMNDVSGTPELVYTVVGTLEGALVASMNRGAKAISQSGGFEAHVKWQRMSRAPMFIFEKSTQAVKFISFVRRNFNEIKQKAELFSNHAVLIDLVCMHDEKVVHVKFVYETGDASGQNMTTTCTWHAMLDLVNNFTDQTGIHFVDFVLEGNASSDKKVSVSSTKNGRGIHVKAECLITEKVLNEVLRVTSKKMEQAFLPSKAQAKRDGMHGYNINVANTIASIFAATGQDLACIHESSVGILEIKATNKGLRVTLTLPNLVIGTVGGGTHLPKQSEALRIMGCQGAEKVQRFAKLIAGFAMGLELSTFSAMVSGEFAKSHEKLGRNKPVNWLTRNELTTPFIKEHVIKNKSSHFYFQFTENALLENGILTHIAGRISKKLIGFDMLTAIDVDSGESTNLILKSKALDSEVIKGLHVIAASIDPVLSDRIKSYWEKLEYRSCHLKESVIYSHLSKIDAKYIPNCWGTYRNDDREIHLILMEELAKDDFRLFNSENHPEDWSQIHIESALQTAHHFHADTAMLRTSDEVNVFLDYNPTEVIPLYEKLIELVCTIDRHVGKESLLKKLLAELIQFSSLSEKYHHLKTIVHNDYNPRNVAIRNDGQVIVYDWELAVVNYPHRDTVEFLSFTLPTGFSRELLEQYLDFDYNLHKHDSCSKEEWFNLYLSSAIEFLLARALFYEVAGIVVKYDFSSRVLENTLRMIHLLTDEE